MLNNGNATSGITSLEEAMEVCDSDFFPNISVIFKLLISLPVGSCSCERSFSALRRLKTWCRSTMVEDRLNHCALMHIHGQHINFDRLQILQMWDSSGRRRIDLAFENQSVDK